MNYVRWTASLYVAVCIVACGRVGYELLPTPEDAELVDDDVGIDAGAEDAAVEDDGNVPGADADSLAEDGGVEDGGALSADATVGADAAAGVDAALGVDAAVGTDASIAVDAGSVEAGPLDAAPRDGASDATGAGNDAAGATEAGADAGADPALMLRYDFAGTGSTVRDRVGTAHAGRGGLTLDGVDDFVDMPNGLISPLQSVTVVAWLDWYGGPCWQRVFDFGSSNAGEGNAGNATSALSLTPASCPDNVVVGFMELDGALRSANGSAFPVNTLAQAALVVDGASSTMQVYINGARVAEAPALLQLSQLRDVNNWLGRSQWVQDWFLRARFEELRIYRRALSASELAALYARGPDQP
jgi:hypothetical protein